MTRAVVVGVVCFLVLVLVLGSLGGLGSVEFGLVAVVSLAVAVVVRVTAGRRAART